MICANYRISQSAASLFDQPLPSNLKIAKANDVTLEILYKQRVELAVHMIPWKKYALTAINSLPSPEITSIVLRLQYRLYTWRIIWHASSESQPVSYAHLVCNSSIKKCKIRHCVSPLFWREQKLGNNSKKTNFCNRPWKSAGLVRQGCEAKLRVWW